MRRSTRPVRWRCDSLRQVSNPTILSFPTGPLGCKCSIVFDEETKQAVVIDPGGSFEKIRSELESLQASVTAIVHTHTHIDHVGATAPLQQQSGAAARIHEADRFLYDMLPVQAALLGMAVPERCDLLGDLNDGTCVGCGRYELEVLHTPGHTPGSVSFLLHGADKSVAFAGDTLFRHSIGRTDLWGGDSAAILQSIRHRLLSLDDTTEVVTGHGPSTCIGEERAANPFLR
jgi:hydroxyacylglutathione hydrolase